MTPTMKLRFVEREIYLPVPGTEGMFAETRTIRVLQQWWRYDPDHDGGEWKDVPLETEE